MGACASRNETDIQVQKEIDHDKKSEARAHKLLLLGAGGSGKSTFFKQLKTIHGDGHSQREKEGFKRQIYGQVIENMQILIRQCKLVTKAGSDETDSDSDNDERAENLRKVLSEEDIAEFKIDTEFDESCKYLLRLPNGSAAMDDTLAAHVKKLWTECAPIRSMFEHRNKICVPDSTGYFFNAIDRIGQGNYVPENGDILLVRYRTTGMTEKEFRIGDANFKIHDVGGQRNERKKWIHFFDGLF
ncbi:GTP-binding alpha subunit [Reticulomyxa filosa]|uniref:GTP-binding alpha subunit n=1 Tax=Reticulomyxa filosa TaxID=46433 RepID=X6PG11_RETFI|nr:GTP-binding alpha subunit [Reticulomyxa filosa]|eukprot:ETO36959.1 GTP-binding alpha subunit [Reticulomyxa filosa]